MLAARRDHNRYLVTPSGRRLGGRGVASLALLGPMLGGPLLAFIAASFGPPLVGVLACLLGVGAFLGAVIAAWVFLLSGSRDLGRAAAMWLSGDTSGPIPLCQKPLGRVFRADVRMRAFYTLGLCAEANGDFLEAVDLFDRAFASVPAMAASKWKRRGQSMMLAHRAVALVALRRLDEADVAVRQASAFFVSQPVNAVLEALTDDAAYGAIGMAAALRDLEPGRDHRALLTLASVVVLAARGMGREANELASRERAVLHAGLLPRERALLANAEARGRGLPSGGPMRSPGLMAAPGGPEQHGWAMRVLPVAS